MIGAGASGRRVCGSAHGASRRPRTRAGPSAARRRPDPSGGHAMTLMEPGERIERGRRTQAEVTGRVAPEPETIFESTWRDYVFAEVWNRPGLDRRSRYWIAMAGAACVGR